MRPEVGRPEVDGNVTRCVRGGGCWEQKPVSGAGTGVVEGVGQAAALSGVELILERGRGVATEDG